MGPSASPRHASCPVLEKSWNRDFERAGIVDSVVRRLGCPRQVHGAQPLSHRHGTKRVPAMHARGWTKETDTRCETRDDLSEILAPGRRVGTYYTSGKLASCGRNISHPTGHVRQRLHPCHVPDVGYFHACAKHPLSRPSPSPSSICKKIAILDADLTVRTTRVAVAKSHRCIPKYRDDIFPSSRLTVADNSLSVIGHRHVAISQPFSFCESCLFPSRRESAPSK